MAARLADPLTRWYAACARDLPWRAADASPWSILVSEVMLQQTPVHRVLPAHRAWLSRWPDPASLARASAGDALRQWGRLGYPRRAVRLHAAAGVIAERHRGQVPSDVADLRALPGVGTYTAAAVASFAFGARHPVVDTNVRRVLRRLVLGTEPASGGVSAADLALAAAMLPRDGGKAAAWSVAAMELGALICTATRPGCDGCPVRGDCAWLAAGSPPGARTAARQPRYAGSDRQCRGAILAVLTGEPGPVPAAALDACWPDRAQRDRVLVSLTADGLAVRHQDGRIGLPGG